jgi:hypothetical protein
MADRFIDFDAARAERTKEPLILRAYGQEFVLPGSMSAALFLDILRMEAERGQDAEVSVKDAIGLLRRVLPDEVLEDLTARPDFGLDDLIALAGMVTKAYSNTAENAPGNPPAPNRAARRATK